MTWAVPKELEDALYDATRAALGDAPLATAALTSAIVDRSQRYTSDRARLAQPADRTADLAARAVFFTVADAMKIRIPLAELANRSALPARHLRVVDLGAGCGAMSLGLVGVVPDVEVAAIDRDAAALEIAAAALRRFTPAITTRIGDVTKAPIPPCDLVVMGTVLNELDETAAIGVVERALAAIADDGAVIIIEPALRATSRALHAIRDAVIARGVHIFAPCTRRIAPCPALSDPDDWCHEDRPLALPPRTAELARLTHLRDGGMKFSYLVLRKQALALVDDPDAWRLVSAARIAKGKHEIIGCSDRGRVPLRLLKRHRSAENRELERADRGEVIVTDAAPDDARVEVTGPITRIDPAR
ncbi:MAG: methyltransferase [Myxococcota bacterium]|nr:methyltransferase [Myxococcota bacterium]